MSERSRDNLSTFPGGKILMPFAESFSEVLPQEVHWLSRGRIALGKITVLDGDPGLGKSTITLEWAARLSRGEALPGGDPPTRPRATLILSAEDGMGDTIRPRLDAAGADLRKIFRFTLRDEDGVEQLPAIPNDLGALEAQIEATNAVMVVIDPLMAYLGGEVKSNSDQDVRRALSPLASVAERTGVAVVILRHLNKATGMASLYRGGGSIGIIGAARFGLLVAKDPEDESGKRRIIAFQKCNIGPEPPAIAYHLEGLPGTDVARVVWEGETHHRAASLMESPRTESDRSLSNEAQGWLLDALAAGPVTTKELQKQARDDAIGWRTIESAKVALGIASGRKGFGPGASYSWWIPGMTIHGRHPHATRHAPSYTADSIPLSESHISHAHHAPHESVEHGDSEE